MKMFMRVILRRLEPIDAFLLPLQAAFRPGRSTEQQVATLNHLIHVAKQRANYRLQLCFLDFKKAFDSVDRHVMRQIMHLWGIPEEISTTVLQYWEDVSLHIRIDGVTDETALQTKAGVLQGDPLSPFLFLLAIDYILRFLRPGVSVWPTHMPALAYADDVVLLSETVCTLRTSVEGYDISPFRMSELQEAVASLSTSRAPGLDGIPNEILKLSRLHPVLLEMCNDVFEQCRIPKLWTQTKLVLLPKPGKDQAVPKGWRWIALMSTVAKLFNRLLLQRLRQRIDSFLLPSQATYRPGRTTIHNVAAIRLLLDEARTRQIKELHILFVDFSAAFDSVSWIALDQILVGWQVPAKIRAAICGNN